MNAKRQSSPATRRSSQNTASRHDDRETWPVYSGESFNLWNPDTGIYYDSVDAMEIASHLYAKAVKGRQQCLWRLLPVTMWRSLPTLTPGQSQSEGAPNSEPGAPVLFSMSQASTHRASTLRAAICSNASCSVSRSS